jgi:hypothetical protein
LRVLKRRLARVVFNLLHADLDQPQLDKSAAPLPAHQPAADMNDDDFLESATEAASVLDAISLGRYDTDVGAAATTIDSQVAGICADLHQASPVQREVLVSALTDRQRTIIGRYGMRAATLALRERSIPRLRSGLIALVLSGSAASDARDFMVAAAVHHHVALQLGQDPAELFDEAATYAGPAGELLQAFGRRQDVTLKAFAWREVATEHGPGFVPA